jgi:hypothetical protein
VYLSPRLEYQEKITKDQAKSPNHNEEEIPTITKAQVTIVATATLL